MFLVNSQLCSSICSCLLLTFCGWTVDTMLSSPLRLRGSVAEGVTPGGGGTTGKHTARLLLDRTSSIANPIMRGVVRWKNQATKYVVAKMPARRRSLGCHEIRRPSSREKRMPPMPAVE